MDGDASFGRWIQRRRQALHLTQAALAAQVYCSTETIRKIEADARRPSPSIAARLVDQLLLPLDLRPIFLKAARGEVTVIRLGAPTPIGADAYNLAAASRLGNVPVPPTPLIGREQLAATVRDLLCRRDMRLVTLTGTPGVGKTHLALQLAIDLQRAFSRGTWFVPLAPVQVPELVVATIASVLGVQDRAEQPLLDQLKEYLWEKQLLLLLDNFEQVVAAAPVVAELLASCPGLKVLVTSRVPLHVRGEKEMVVQPLTLPDLQQPLPAASLTQYTAVDLFMQRARDVQPTLVITDDNAPVIAEICIRLDGLPLAIELAAARLKLLSPEALLMRLNNRLAVLTGGARDLPQRQQTLRTTLTWSYELLDRRAQTLFARLAVFAGGCTLDAVEVVCRGADDGRLDLLDGLATLVDNSLLRREEAAGEVRFTMLETLLEYASEQLAASGEEEALQGQHAAYYLTLAEIAEPKLRGPEQREWLNRLERDFDNLRATVEWSLRAERQEPPVQTHTASHSLPAHTIALSRVEFGARLCLALHQFWVVRRNFILEGIGWLERVVASADMLSAGLCAWLRYTLGDLQSRAGPRARARQRIDESLALFRDLGDRRGVALALIRAGELTDDPSEAVVCWEESLALARELGDQHVIAAVLLWLGLQASRQADYERAGPRLEEALSLYRRLGHRHGVCDGLLCLGILRFRQGEHAAARALNEERLTIARALGDASGIAHSIHWIGLIAFAQGDVGRARMLLEESLALRRAQGLKSGIAHALTCLGHVAATQRDAAPARALLEAGLALHRELEDQRDSALAIAGFAALAAAQGEWKRAVRLLGSSEALRAHSDREPEEQLFHGRLVAAARVQLDEAAFAMAWAEGHALTLEQVAGEVLVVMDPNED
jgi:predicted ATPase/transcriptional regulator with XRE-family HTH domain